MHSIGSGALRKVVFLVNWPGAGVVVEVVEEDGPMPDEIGRLVANMPSSMPKCVSAYWELLSGIVLIP